MGKGLSAVGPNTRAFSLQVRHNTNACEERNDDRQRVRAQISALISISNYSILTVGEQQRSTAGDGANKLQNAL